MTYLTLLWLCRLWWQLNHSYSVWSCNPSTQPFCKSCPSEILNGLTFPLQNKCYSVKTTGGQKINDWFFYFPTRLSTFSVCHQTHCSEHAVFKQILNRLYFSASISNKHSTPSRVRLISSPGYSQVDDIYSCKLALCFTKGEWQGQVGWQTNKKCYSKIFPTSVQNAAEWHFRRQRGK